MMGYQSVVVLVVTWLSARSRPCWKAAGSNSLTLNQSIFCELEESREFVPLFDKERGALPVYLFPDMEM